jgi:hypothetical protein
MVMHLRRWLVGLVAVGIVVSLSVFAQDNAPPGTQMTTAAQKFLAALPDDLKTQASLGFDDKERLHWEFVPLQDKDRKPTRKGVRLELLSPEQRQAALDLLKTGLSTAGFTQATGIMGLEDELAMLEKNGRNVRSPGWYFVTIFGTPGAASQWGWRFEGHHLSLNYTLDKGAVVSATPCFLGANPAHVKSGPKQGLQLLASVEDPARALIRSLTPDQVTASKQPKPLPEVDIAPKAEVAPLLGVTADKLTVEQKATLRKLLAAYADRLPTTLANAEMQQIDAKFDAIRFAYAGSAEPGQGYTYRVVGPTFAVQFLNEQADAAGNKANHIHSAFRRLPADFGVEK